MPPSSLCHERRRRRSISGTPFLASRANIILTMSSTGGSVVGRRSSGHRPRSSGPTCRDQQESQSRAPPHRHLVPHLRRLGFPRSIFYSPHDCHLTYSQFLSFISPFHVFRLSAQPGWLSPCSSLSCFVVLLFCFSRAVRTSSYGPGYLRADVWEQAVSHRASLPVIP